MITPTEIAKLKKLQVSDKPVVIGHEQTSSDDDADFAIVLSMQDLAHLATGNAISFSLRKCEVTVKLDSTEVPPPLH